MTRPGRILIAGGTSGIGLGMARAFRRRGHDVVVVARNPTRVAANDDLVADVCDVTSSVAVAAVLAQHGPFDIVVFSSAVSSAPSARFETGMGPIADVDVMRELNTNIGGAIVLSQAWLATRTTATPGAFVCVGSPAGLAPATALLYATTKGGLHTFVRGLRHQLRNSKVRVVEVLPPAVDTPLNTLPMAKAKPDDVGERAVAGILAGREVVHVGPTWIVSLLARLAPSLAMSLVDRASRMG